MRLSKDRMQEFSFRYKTSKAVQKSLFRFTHEYTASCEAAKALNFGTQKTMRIAQQLYEGVDIKGGESVLLRASSTRSARTTESKTKRTHQQERIYFCLRREKYTGAAGRRSRRKERKIQEYMRRSVRLDISRGSVPFVSTSIWNRISQWQSRMMPAQYESTSLRLQPGSIVFRFRHQDVFDGLDLSIQKLV